MKKSAFITLICMALILPGCLGALKATTTFGVPAIKVAEGAMKVSQVLTDREEYYLGRGVAANILSMHKLHTDPKLTEYVNLVGKAVAIHSESPETFGGYHFAILDSNEINAFACPGGIIFITKGLLDIIKTEDELAAVLAHEIAHVNNKDGMNAVQASRWTQFMAVVGSAAAQVYGSEGFGKIVGIFENSVDDIVKTIVINGYGKNQELSADGKAVKYLGYAGYDSGAIVKVLGYYKEREISDNRGFFKTHPATEDRIKYLEKYGKKIDTVALSDDFRQKRFAEAIAR